MTSKDGQTLPAWNAVGGRRSPPAIGITRPRGEQCDRLRQKPRLLLPSKGLTSVEENNSAAKVNSRGKVSRELVVSYGDGESA
jgi:hypothetical protein